MRLLRVQVSSCVLVGAVVALAMRDVRSQETSQSTPLRAGVEIVDVPVTVLDGKREPVRGLRAEDFTVLEDGKRRPIVAFAAVDVSRPASAGSDSPRLASEGRLVVIMLDRSIPYGAPTEIARLVARSAVQSMAPNDIGAVIYTGTSQRSQDLTADPAELLAAIDGQQPSSTDTPETRARDSLEHGRLGAELGRVVPDFDLSGECLCGLCVLDTITHIAKALERFPRRSKSLVFIGVDLNIETRQVQCASKVRDTRRVMFEALDVSSLTVHAIDASGLETRLTPASSRSVSEIDRVGTRHLERQGNLAVLPDRTGGRFVLQTNDPDLVIADILSENSSYYIVAFQPDGPPDGKTHEIRVRVNRSGTDIHTRRAYVREQAAAN